MQPVREDQREYSLLLRWLGLALMVVSIKEAELGSCCNFNTVKVGSCCVCVFSLLIIFFAFHLFPGLAFIFPIHTFSYILCMPFKIYYTKTKFCFILRFFGLYFEVCLVIRISDPPATLLLGKLVRQKQFLLKETEQTK